MRHIRQERAFRHICCLGLLLRALLLAECVQQTVILLSYQRVYNFCNDKRHKYYSEGDHDLLHHVIPVSIGAVDVAPDSCQNHAHTAACCSRSRHAVIPEYHGHQHGNYESGHRYRKYVMRHSHDRAHKYNGQHHYIIQQPVLVRKAPHHNSIKQHCKKHQSGRNNKVPHQMVHYIRIDLPLHKKYNVYANLKKEYPGCNNAVHYK